MFGVVEGGGYLAGADQLIHVAWLEIAFLGDVEVAVRLGVKSWFANVGLSTSDSPFRPVNCFQQG